MLLGALGLAWLFGMLPARAQALGEDVTQGLRDGDFDLAFRYRYEFVHQAGFDKDANASILWSRLTYRSAAVRDFSLTLNMDNVAAIGVSDYNSTRNGKSQYPLVPDPTGTDLNLASLTYTGLDQAEIVVGWQRIKRSNDRLISNVPWRQNETTYDAADYYDLELGLQRDGFRLRGAYEVLGGGLAPGQAMQTPLGLVHAFQGWADQFAVTPRGGVTDVYAAADVDLLRGQFSLVYHDFSSEVDGMHYGDELDFSAAWPLAEHYTLWAGFALYDADSFSTDTDRIGFMLSASF